MKLTSFRSGIHTLVFLLALAGCTPRPTAESGISESLARERKTNIRNVSYDLFFNIPAEHSDSLTAEVTIHFQWAGMLKNRS